MVKRGCDAEEDHLSLTCILKIKSEPATNSIKRLVDVFSSYTFSLYYLKDKDIVEVIK